MTGDEHDKDLFMSYSHADANAIVEPLVGELQAFGLDVWYDKGEITIGNSIPDSIDEGLRVSDFGVTILSENYFEGMSKWEYDGLVQRHNTEGNVILPLWYGIDHDDVYSRSPSLASIRAEKLTRDNIQSVAAQIYRVVKTDREEAESWGENTDEDDEEAPSFTSINIRFQEHFEPEIGKEVTILSWRNHGGENISSLEAAKIRDEERGIEFKSSSYGTMMTVKRIDDEPLNGIVSDIKTISSRKTEFTIRLEQSRIDQLPDDRDYYKSGLVG